jgi:hypothetical protein
MTSATMTSARRVPISSATAVVVALAVCAGGLAGPGSATAAPEAAEAKASIAKLRKKAKRKTIKAVKQRLVAMSSGPGLAQPGSPAKVKVRSCKLKTKRNPRRFTCSWIAKGELPGLVPVKCDGRSVFDARRKKLKRVGRCNNRLDPQAPLLAAPHDLSFGYFEDFQKFGDLFDELRAGGANAAREGIGWKALQPSPGGDPASWNWARFDAAYSGFVNAGVRPVWTLINAPCWAASPGRCDSNTTNPVAPSHVGDYANVAAQVALRYPTSAAIEVWLEPNGAKFWGAEADPPLFSDLVAAAAQAVHATGTGVAVFSGGLAPGSQSPDKLEMGEFLAQAVARGGIQAADAIGFHAVADVPFAPGSDPTGGYLGRLRIQIQELDDVLAEAGLERPIAVTQLSYSTAGPGAYTEAQQAEALVSSYEVLRRIAGIPIVIVSKLLDPGDGSKVSGFGVLRGDRVPKPAFCALAAARGVPPPSGC